MRKTTVSFRAGPSSDTTAHNARVGFVNRLHCSFIVNLRHCIFCLINVS